MSKAALFTGALLAISAGTLCLQAQSSNPDYSNVTDYLNGQRNLLQVNDLMVGPLVIKTQDGSQVDPSSIYPAAQIPPHDQYSGPQILTRMFDLAFDTLVWGRATDIHATNPITKQDQSLTLSIYNTKFSGSTLAAGDFNGDGFPEVVLGSADTLQVIGAVDPEDFSKGLRAGGAWNYPLTQFNPVSVAVGDFNGDGKPEVAIAYNATATDLAMHVQILTVDPGSLNVTLQADIALSPNSGTTGPDWSALVAGHFSNTLYDQLAIVYSSNNQVQVQSLDFRVPSLTPVLVGTQLSNVPPGPDVWAVKGHFDPNSQYDQMAMKYGTLLGIVSFDSQLHIQYPPFYPAPNIRCSSGMAAGNFARTDPNPSNPSTTQPSLKQQIAISTSDCNGDNLGLSIYNVEPPATGSQYFTITQNSVLGTDWRDPNLVKYYGNWIISGDIQGRSLVLGAPTKAVLEGTRQLYGSVAMPPMHVDFIAPVFSTTPQVFNVSAVPDSFYSQYDSDSKGSDQSAHTDSGGWTFSGKETVGASFEVGSVKAGEGTRFSDTFTATQNLAKNSSETHGNYTSHQFDASTQTGSGDYIWFNDERFNLYIYPVIGQVGCPIKLDPCQPGQKVPLTVQFSAPDDISSGEASGNLIEWYQPTWEPYNVLSYPGSYSQLRLIYPDLEKLSDDEKWLTSTESRVEKSTWTADKTHSTDSTYTQNYAESNDISVVGKGGIGGIYSVGFNLDFNFGGSDSIGSMDTGVNSLGKSAGIAVAKPGTFASPFDYAYWVSPYIFGQFKPASSDVSNPSNPEDTTSITSGRLRTAFVVDPLSSSAGGWWLKAYGKLPDVALNHPSRWTLTPSPLTGSIPPNCLALGSRPQTDCATFNASHPEDPWDSEFHAMRGFFISRAPVANTPPGQGPQLSSAVAGDQIYLQARVYNYSLKAMPDGTVVHVRFYLQPWDKVNGVPSGNSVLVGEKQLGPIPPFNTEDGGPLNWIMATTTWDTTNYANQQVVFWVLVWMEDQNGKLAPEIEGHGLQALPAAQLNSLADVKAEGYSNNVGFYRSIFTILPPKTGLGAAPPAKLQALSIGKIKVSIPEPTLNQTISVSALISSGDDYSSSAIAMLYDGDPNTGGKLFDVESVPYLSPHDSAILRVPYHVQTCGLHNLFIVTGKGTPYESVRRSAPVRVSCGADLLRQPEPLLDNR